MPDIPNRLDEEAALAAILSAMFARHQDELTEWLEANAGRARRLPPGLLAAFRNDVAEAVQTTIAGVHSEAAQRIAEQLGYGVSTDEAVARADQYARDRAAEIGTAIAERLDTQTQEALALAATVTVGLVASEEARALVTRALETVTGAGRAETIAATEVTTANTAGELARVDDVERRTGMAIMAVWVTERDDRVCPRCEAMDGAPRQAWKGDAEHGPPLHPSCRCFVEYAFQ